jgi:hypothetical protein
MALALALALAWRARPRPPSGLGVYGTVRHGPVRYGTVRYIRQAGPASRVLWPDGAGGEGVKSGVGRGLESGC